jgi:hypothetical protein
VFELHVCSITQDVKQLGLMSMRFADFDIAGKELYIDKVSLQARQS